MSPGDFDNQPVALEHVNDDSQESDLAIHMTTNANGDGPVPNNAAQDAKYPFSSSIPPPPPSNKKLGDNEFNMVTQLSSSMANPQKRQGCSSEPGASAQVLSLRGDPLDLSLPRNLSSSSLSRNHLSPSPQHGGHGHLSPSRAHGHVGIPQHGHGHLSPSLTHGHVSTPRLGMHQYQDDVSDADQNPPANVTDYNSDDDYEPLKDYLNDLHLSKYFKLLRDNQVTTFDIMSGSKTAWQHLIMHVCPQANVMDTLLSRCLHPDTHDMEPTDYARGAFALDRSRNDRTETSSWG